jgi:vacuolar-type H+-ATPase subunit I/STV1
LRKQIAEALNRIWADHMEKCRQHSLKPEIIQSDVETVT